MSILKGPCLSPPPQNCANKLSIQFKDPSTLSECDMLDFIPDH